MKKISVFIFTAVFSLISSGWLSAQQEPKYSFDFYTLGWDTSTTDLKYQRSGNATPILVTSNLPTGPYRYSGDTPMQFFSVHPGPDGTEQNKLEGEYQISNAPSAPLLLIFLKQPDNSGLPYRVLGISNAIALSRTDEVTLINLSSKNVGGKLNDATFSATPGSTQQIGVVPGENLNISLRLARQGDNGWEHVFSTIWGENPNTQSIIFIIEDPKQPEQLLVKRTQLNRLAVKKRMAANKAAEAAKVVSAE